MITRKTKIIGVVVVTLVACAILITTLSTTLILAQQNSNNQTCRIDNINNLTVKEFRNLSVNDVACGAANEAYASFMDDVQTGIDKLVADGTITQSQADQVNSWISDAPSILSNPNLFLERVYAQIDDLTLDELKSKFGESLSAPLSPFTYDPSILLGLSGFGSFGGLDAKDTASYQFDLSSFGIDPNNLPQIDEFFANADDTIVAQFGKYNCPSGLLDKECITIIEATLANLDDTSKVLPAEVLTDFQFSFANILRKAVDYLANQQFLPGLITDNEVTAINDWIDAMPAFTEDIITGFFGGSPE